MTIKEISVAQANEMLQDTNRYELVDVREEEEYQEVHAQLATLIPLGELEERHGEISKDRDILLICRSGARSMRAAQWLADHGYDSARLHNVAGGTNAWVAADLPTVYPTKLEE